MKTASELFREFLSLVRHPSEVAALFAADGVLELPYLEDLGMPWQYRGRGDIAGLYTRLLELVPDWEFREAVVLIDSGDRLFAEYKVDASAVATERQFKQHFFGYLLADGGEIKVLREALNIVETARAFLPNGLADLAPIRQIEGEGLPQVLGKISVEHVRVRASKSFDEVTSAFDARLGRFDPELYKRLLDGSEFEAERAALEAMAGPDGLMLFCDNDHDVLLQLAGQAKRAVQYLVGNPLIALQMTQLDVRSSLYAPLRVLIYDEEGSVFVEYDKPSSLFGQFGNPKVTEVATMLDQKLNTLVEEAIR